MGLVGVIQGFVPRPRRIVLYGVDGIGKTTWAAGAPSPIFLPTEDGCNDVGVARFPLIRSYGEFNTRVSEVLTGDHNHKTLVVDTLDWLERLIWEDVAKEECKSSIEKIGYGKGPKMAIEKWAFVLKSLDHIVSAKRMAIILLAHAKMVKVEEPDNDPYTKYGLDLHDTLAPMIREWADEVLFANYKTYTVRKETGEGFNKTRNVGVGGKERLIYTDGSPSYFAKRRITLPDVLPMEFSEYVKAVKAARPKKGDMIPDASAGDIEGIVKDGSSKVKEETTNGE